ncbi:MAG: YbdK family carboxylate-amine ligase [Betaproteobacteria bacterium]
MDEMAFKPSAALSVGVELELQLVRPRDLDLAREAAELLARLERRKLPGAVKPEITESMIELNSAVHSSCGALAAELEVMRAAVVAEADVLNLRVCGGGAHPFHEWSERRIFPTERFRNVLERYGYLAKQFTVFGQHIHVGSPGGDEAIYLTHMLTRHVPHFIALSAASPYYQGEDTTFQSSRLTAINAFPLAGHIPFVPDWAGFLDYFGEMKRFGIVASMKDFYWDIRPKPEYGTVEIRVCDTPLTVERAALLAAYAQALAALYLEERRAPARAVYMVNSFNRFEAARYGLKGRIVDAYSGATRSLGEDLHEWLAAVARYGAALGSAAALARLAADVRTGYSDAQWLRERRGPSGSMSGSLSDVVRAASERWASRGAF